MARLFTLTITMDNDAFNDGMGGREELSQIIDEIPGQMADSDERYLYDSNGSKVGMWSIIDSDQNE